jgi:hypothetical protein
MSPLMDQKPALPGSLQCMSRRLICARRIAGQKALKGMNGIGVTALISAARRTAI